jgi:tryptophanyl-tRNA synthetase
LNDKKYLDTILLEGSVKADKIASKKIKKIKELVGF